MYKLVLCFIPFFTNSQIKTDFNFTDFNDTNAYTFTLYGTNKGLPQNQVNSIIQKENGNLIIGTSNGIVEFNGVEFKQFIKDDTYKNLNIINLIWDEKNNFLYGSEIDGTSHLLFPNYSKIINGKYLNISGKLNYTIDKNGNIFLYNKLKLIKTIKTGVKNTNYLYIHNTKAYISTTDSIYVFNFNSRITHKISNKHCQSIKINPFTNEILILNKDNIRSYKNGKAHLILNLKEQFKDIQITNIEFVNKQEYWLTSKNGLYKITKNKQVKTINSLPSDYLQFIHYIKDEKCFFIGSGDKGLIKINRNDVKHIYTLNGFAKNASICSIIMSKHNKILSIDNNGNIYQLVNNQAKIKSNLHFSSSTVTEINDTLYAGTWGDGIKVIKNNKIIYTIKNYNKIQSTSIHTIYQDKSGNIWIGGDKGISFGNNINNTKPVLINKINDVSICFYELKNGNICLGGNNGIYIISKGLEIILHLNKINGLIGKEVRGFYEDKEGKLWIATYGGGIYCLKNNKLTSINKMNNCMLNQNAFCLAPDEYGYLNITSNNGLWRVKESDLNDFYYKRKNTLIPFYYGEETGIINTEFNGGFQNNYLRTKHDLLYFPNLQGIVLVNPDEPILKQNKTNIERIIVNGTIYNEKEHLFNRQTRTININYSCANFTNKQNIYYQYKLVGTKSENWSNLNKSNFVTFNLLPPGKYIFSVRTIDAFNDNNPPESSYAFEIQPYFYETIWFKSLSFAIFLLLTIIIVRLRLQMYRRQAEQKESIAKQIAELELKVIQSQLNPHFIFNCMNTIKYFIMSKKINEANSGLNNLSKLLRYTIEDSANFISTLNAEIDLVENYLCLEKMRLQNQLNWKINIAPGISENALYPRLFIQTFVENSIKHGISNLINKLGILEIEVFKTEYDIICIIKDNGIGRAASLKLNEKKNLHKSKGINLIEEKKKYLNTLKKQNIEINYIDLKDLNNTPTGTMIIIKTPLNL